MQLLKVKRKIGQFPIVHLDSGPKGPGLIHTKLHKPFDIFTLYLGNIMKGDLITQHKSTIRGINREEQEGHGEILGSDWGELQYVHRLL